MALVSYENRKRKGAKSKAKYSNFLILNKLVWARNVTEVKDAFCFVLFICFASFSLNSFSSCSFSQVPIL